MNSIDLQIKNIVWHHIELQFILYSVISSKSNVRVTLNSIVANLKKRYGRKNNFFPTFIKRKINFYIFTCTQYILCYTY